MYNLDENTDLLKKLQEGDEKAFEQLFIAYREWLFMTAFALLKNEIEAEELVQEFFIDLWSRKIIKTKIDSTAHLRNYLFLAIRNRCRNKIARDETQRKRFRDFKPIQSFPQPDAQLENKELCVVLERAFDQLPPQQAQVFYMAYMDKMSSKEIGYLTSLAEKTVRNYIQLSLKTLRKLLKKAMAVGS